MHSLEQSLTQVMRDFDQERQQLKNQNKEEQKEQRYSLHSSIIIYYCYSSGRAELTAVRRSLELLKRENKHLRHLGRKILQQVMINGHH